MEEEKFLRAIPILQDLNEEELRQLLKIARRVQYPKGQVILKEGETGETHVYHRGREGGGFQNPGYEVGPGRLPGSG